VLAFLDGRDHWLGEASRKDDQGLDCRSVFRLMAATGQLLVFCCTGRQSVVMTLVIQSFPGPCTAQFSVARISPAPLSLSTKLFINNFDT